MQLGDFGRDLGSLGSVLVASWSALGDSGFRDFGSYLTYFSRLWKSFDLKIGFLSVLTSISSHMTSILSHLTSSLSHLTSSLSQVISEAAK